MPVCGTLNRKFSTVFAAAVLLVVGLAYRPAFGGGSEVPGRSQYRVSPGETLASVAKKIWGDSTCWAGLLWANSEVPFPFAYWISPGDRLWIPPKCVRFPAPKPGAGTYRVPAETTFAQLANEVYGEPYASLYLRRINLHLDPSATIPAGTVVYTRLPADLLADLQDKGIDAAQFKEPAERSVNVAMQAPKPGTEVETIVVPPVHVMTLTPRPWWKPPVHKAIAYGAWTGAIATGVAALAEHLRANGTYDSFQTTTSLSTARALEDQTRQGDGGSMVWQWAASGFAISGAIAYFWPSFGRWVGVTMNNAGSRVSEPARSLDRRQLGVADNTHPTMARYGREATNEAN